MKLFEKVKSANGKRSVYIFGFKCFSYVRNHKAKNTYREIFHRQIMRDGTPVLEIGPFCNPFLTGNNVSYFEIMSPNEIECICLESKRTIHEIPKHIDYISPVGDLAIIDKKFDKIFSSHMIEHTTDLVKHLRDIETILTERGEYYIIIPDKRYCFDYFKAETTLGDVLEAYYNKEKFQPLRVLINSICLNTHK